MKTPGIASKKSPDSSGLFFIPSSMADLQRLLRFNAAKRPAGRSHILDIQASGLVAAQRQVLDEQQTVSVSAARGAVGSPLLRLMNRRCPPVAAV